MKNFYFNYTEDKKWSALPSEEFNSLDSLIICFFSPEKKIHSVLKELKNNFQRATVVGCSTAGEIFGKAVSDNSISAVAIKFESSEFRTFEQKLSSSDDSYTAGESLGKSLLAPDLKACFLISDGLVVNGSQLVNGINTILGDKNLTIGGGLAADADRFQETTLFRDNEFLSNHVLAIGFYGENINVSSSTHGGWDIFGPERIVTKSSGNVLYEIDDQPALDLYKKYLGTKAEELPSSGLLFPLQIRKSSEDKNRIVRTILAIDEESNSLIFAGDIPEGSYAQLMRANFDRVIDAASEASEDILLQYLKEERETSSTKNSVNFAVSCVGRRLVLGDRTDEELEALSCGLGTENFIGFYSYGEIAQQQTKGLCELHNQSMTLFSLSEKVSIPLKVAS